MPDLLLYASTRDFVAGTLRWSIDRHDDDGFLPPVVFPKSKAIETLIKHEWNRSFVVPAAGMFLDIPMNDDQLKAVSTLSLHVFLDPFWVTY